jgi:hypothetical protein
MNYLSKLSKKLVKNIGLTNYLRFVDIINVFLDKYIINSIVLVADDISSLKDTRLSIFNFINL